MVASPLNYTGGKFKLLPQIIPLFPQEIDTFVDLFCGGGNVGANVRANAVFFNDFDSNVIGILSAFKAIPKEEIIQFINNTIEDYRLSNVSANGYDFYDCDSAKGLGQYNRNQFLQLRKDFNNLPQRDYHYYLLLYVLVIFSFNNQIRFNQSGKFNLPVGKRDFNGKMQSKLSQFIDKLQEVNCVFSNADFRQIDIEQFNENDFVYADPPYLITCATYNEQGGWTEQLEHDLYEFLDNLHAHNIRFALSNVLTSKGNTNTILQQWLEDNPQYNCHHLNYTYSNSNYQVKDRTLVSDEVLITNY